MSNERLKEITSTQLIGNVHRKFKDLGLNPEHWKVFYDGWIEGRNDLFALLSSPSTKAEEPTASRKGIPPVQEAREAAEKYIRETRNIPALSPRNTEVVRVRITGWTHRKYDYERLIGTFMNVRQHENHHDQWRTENGFIAALMKSDCTVISTSPAQKMYTKERLPENWCVDTSQADIEEIKLEFIIALGILFNTKESWQFRYYWDAPGSFMGYQWSDDEDSPNAKELLSCRQFLDLVTVKPEVKPFNDNK